MYHILRFLIYFYKNVQTNCKYPTIISNIIRRFVDLVNCLRKIIINKLTASVLTNFTKAFFADRNKKAPPNPKFRLNGVSICFYHIKSKRAPTFQSRPPNFVCNFLSSSVGFNLCSCFFPTHPCHQLSLLTFSGPKISRL